MPEYDTLKNAVHEISEGITTEMLRDAEKRYRDKREIIQTLNDIAEAEAGRRPTPPVGRILKESEFAAGSKLSQKVDKRLEDAYDRGYFGIPTTIWKGMYNEYPVAVSLVAGASVIGAALVIGLAIGAI